MNLPLSFAKPLTQSVEINLKLLNFPENLCSTKDLLKSFYDRIQIQQKPYILW